MKILKTKKTKIITQGAKSLLIDLYFYFFLLNLCILYLGLLGMECVIEGIEGLFVYQVSAAEDKFTPVTYRRRQVRVIMCNNV